MDIFSIVMFLTAVLFLYFIFRGINKNKILLENAGIWITVGFILVIFSIFPDIPSHIASLLGFQITSNLLLFLAVIFLLLITFTQSQHLSKQQNQINILIQELSILKSKQMEEQKSEEK